MCLDMFLPTLVRLHDDRLNPEVYKSYSGEAVRAMSVHILGDITHHTGQAVPMKAWRSSQLEAVK